MARLLTAGAEWGNGSADWPNTAGDSVAAVTAAARSGTYGLKSASGGLGKIDARSLTYALGTTYYMRTYVKRVTSPTGADSYIPVMATQVNGAPATGHLHLFIDENGKLELRQNSVVATDGTQLYITTNALVADQWYLVELGWKIASGSGDDYAELRIDESSVYSSSTLTIATVVPDRVYPAGGSAAGGSSWEVHFDDVAINDSTGASQTSWPGPGKVVLCIPTSDSQDGSWRGGAGGTGIDFSTAVNNIPPAGLITGSATDTSQIESADSSGDNTTDEYRANLTTYTAAGIGASDTITLVHPIVNAGEDISTNSKGVSVGAQSNPAGTMAGGTVDGGAIGTWPTGWRTFYGPPVYSPSVTLGNSPVVALRKTDTGTRVLGVDALGLYVEYVPAAAAATAFDAQPGSFSVVGVATSAVAARMVDAASGTYAVSGAAAGTVRGFQLSVDPAGYTVTGTAAALFGDRVLSLDPGTYVLSGFAASPVSGRVVSADAAAYAFTGFQVAPIVDRLLSVDPTSYAVDGVAASPVAGRVLSADLGAYVFTGFDVTAVSGASGTAAYEIDAQPGIYVLTGLLAAAIADRIVNASPGSYDLAGAAAGLIGTRILSVDPGAYAFTGASAGAVAGRMISADPATFAVTGVLSNLIAARVLDATPGAYVLTGAAAAAVADRAIAALSGTFTVDGQPATLVVNRVIAASPGEFIVTGVAATLDYSGAAPVVLRMRTLMGVGL